MSEIPSDAVNAVRHVFAACNAAASSKLTMVPNTQEESLDLTWIDEITKFASPQVVGSGWVIRCDAHYLGGLRHFENFEIADIGVLVHMRFAQGVRKSKVVLLQSTRLYPTAGHVREETLSDYETGFARLADPEDEALPIALERVFRFDEASRYNALKRDSDQVSRIDAYQKKVGIPVYYHLYNPWETPLEQLVPLRDPTPPDGAPALGTRVVPAGMLHDVLKTSSAASPSVADLADLGELPAHGWRIEDFIADEVLSCRQGHVYGSIRDSEMVRLFNRRSGPIAAAIAITIESPDVAAAPA